jgi:acetyl-CoA C-acetyltransferase
MIDDRLPVVVAAAQVTERDEEVYAVDLAARAAGDALAQAPAIAPKIGVVSLVNVLARTGPAPAAAIARHLALSPARTETTHVGGNTPQWLVTRSASAIAAGEIEAALIVGSETQRSSKLRRDLRTSGRDTPSHSYGDEGMEPDPRVGDERPGVGDAELAAGLMAPVHIYPLFESVLAARSRRSFPEQRAFLGRLMAPFTEVASKHPAAWFREVRTPEEIAGALPGNRVVSEPYTKLMCAFINVDQAAALVVCSLGAARAAGIADRAVFVHSGADANDVWFPSARPDPGTSPGIRVATRAALTAAGAGIDEMGAFDLYSCFPCAVELAAEAMGIALDDSRGLTVTGGLPYFGGPGNDYTLHAIATMVEQLRGTDGSGLVSGLGWYATKHSIGIYGGRPPERGFATGDTRAEQSAIDATAVEVAGRAEGAATVVAATVTYNGAGDATGAPIVALLGDGRHIAAMAEDSDLAAIGDRNLVGERVHVSGSPPRYHVLGP